MLMLTIIGVVFLLILICLLTYQIRIDSYTRRELFKVQMEMGKGQQSMTKELPWSELRKIIDEIVVFTTINYIITNGISKMKDTELTLNWTGILTEISVNVDLSLSDEIKRQILKNISRDYLTSYIKNSVQYQIIFNLEKNKDNMINKRLENIHEKVPSMNNKIES